MAKHDTFYSGTLKATEEILAALNNVPESHRESVLKFVIDLAARNPNAVDQVSVFVPKPEPHHETVTEPEKEKSRTRKRVSLPPKGQSCRARITKLRDDKFFSEKRSPSDIVTGLAKKGWTHTVNQVGAALTPMFEKGEIQRTKEGNGFKYFWDRE